MPKLAKAATLRLLLATTAVAAAGAGQAALAQAAPGGSADSSLAEVVVTATRQTSTINKVPLSITAETQAALDQQGIKTLNDLQGTVPALQINQQLSPGVANISIRSIQQGSQGAATTGFYLDDTPMQKRNVGYSAGTTANGTPLPPLFDVERVEVLRGPQGTLFGGSSEGGTIRYITPQPSLTRFSEYVRGETSQVDHGGWNYEGGAAIGGPIVQDKLGFRVSMFDRHRAGWIDYINPFSQAVDFKNANSVDERVFRGALAWAPTDNLKITLAWLSSRVSAASALQQTTLPTGKITTPTECYNIPAALAGASAVKGIPSSTAYPGGSVTHVLNPAPVGVNGACAALMASGAATYTRAGATYGPYNFGPDDTLDLYGMMPSVTSVNVPTLTVDYDLGWGTMKAITSLVRDKNASIAGDTSQIANTSFTFGGQIYGDAGGVPVPQGVPLLAQIPDYAKRDGHFFARNVRHGITQEIRFASPAGERRVSWVAGLFYSNIHQHSSYQLYYDFDNLTQSLYGMTPLQRYGVPPLDYAGNGIFNVFGRSEQQLQDLEYAAFGEVNVAVTSKLKLIAGLRLSREEFNYSAYLEGPVNSQNVATLDNQLRRQGGVTESPLTPKVGLQYQVTPNDQVYATVSKGFRPGGVNIFLAPNVCGPALALFGLTSSDVPSTYKSDSVWNYELGTKLRLFNGKAQINGDVYRIDWTNVQAAQSPGFGCGVNFTANAGGAVSQGIELETDAKPLPGLTVHFAGTYNDAHYTSTAAALTGLVNGVEKQLLVSEDGQKFAVPPWSIDVGVRYDFAYGAAKPYVRADYRVQSRYDTIPPGLPTYTPDAYRVPAFYSTNLRAGVEYGDFDINVFATNLFDYQKGPLTGGRASCSTASLAANAACATYSSYNPFITVNATTPRTIGIQIAYRH